MGAYIEVKLYEDNTIPRFYADGRGFFGTEEEHIFAEMVATVLNIKAKHLWKKHMREHAAFIKRIAGPEINEDGTWSIPDFHTDRKCVAIAETTKELKQ